MKAWSLSAAPDLSDDQYADWLQLVEQRTGIDFSLHRSILQTGLRRRLRELDRTDYEAYFQQVSAVPEGLAEWQFLLAHLTVKETSFFRQPAAYELVRAWLRKRLQRPVETSLDLWSVGCSTGEEPYSLAITANEAIAFSGQPTYFGVLATDICAQALQQARTAQYSGRRLERLSESLRRRYFEPRDAAGDEPQFQVSETLRKRVCFNLGNLLQLERMPVLPMDVIFCQNVLVYFRRERTKQILDALTDRLKPGGLLVVGPGEAAHWQHPAMVRTQQEGVTAWLRRTESPVATQV